MYQKLKKWYQHSHLQHLSGLSPLKIFTNMVPKLTFITLSRVISLGNTTTKDKLHVHQSHMMGPSHFDVMAELLSFIHVYIYYVHILAQTKAQY